LLGRRKGGEKKRRMEVKKKRMGRGGLLSLAADGGF
jgi:hypothetical protein